MSAPPYGYGQQGPYPGSMPLQPGPYPGSNVAPQPGPYPGSSAGPYPGSSAAGGYRQPQPPSPQSYPQHQRPPPQHYQHAPQQYQSEPTGGVAGTAVDRGVTEQWVSLTFSCNSLPSADVIGKSDPYLVIRTPTGQVYKSSVVMNDHNPTFTESYKLEFKFSEEQPLRFEVWDWDKSNKDDLLCTLDTKLSSLMGQTVNRNLKMINNLRGSKKHPTITVIVNELKKSSRGTIKFTMRGVKLDNKDFIGKSDAFVRFFKNVAEVNERATWVKFYETKVIKNNLNPEWDLVVVKKHDFCNKGDDSEVRLECYDWDADGSNDFIGEATITLNKLRMAKYPKMIAEELINPKKQAKKKSYHNSGKLVFQNVEITEYFNFSEYLRSGLRLSCQIAIDFTGSNGNARDPRSLHHFDQSGQAPNQYEQAMRSCLNILKEYDDDNIYPVFGFGGKLPNGVLSHHFTIGPKSGCVGTEEVLRHYRDALNQITLWGPTNFSETIEYASQLAKCSQVKQDYTILLIITDGAITDIVQTLKAIKRACEKPLSIVIVGVGSADFSTMDMLDGDDKAIASRDIVQFVPYRNMKQNGPLLAQEVLREIPSQCEEYMALHNIKPNTDRQ